MDVSGFHKLRGRYEPFAVAANAAAANGGQVTPQEFGSAGQPFTTKVTARNAGGAATLNYDGSTATSPNFAQATTLSDAGALGLGRWLHWLLPEVMADKERQEALVRGSALHWTVLRPARLSHAPSGADLHVGENLRWGWRGIPREDVAALMNVGDVAGLFPPEDVDQLCDAMRTVARDTPTLAPPPAGGAPAAPAAKREMSKDALMGLFTQRVRRNLHVVLCASVLPDVLRPMLRKFPSLANCAAIISFPPWPAEALRTVAATSLRNVDGVDPSAEAAIVDTCVLIHTSVAAAAVAASAESGDSSATAPLRSPKLSDSWMALPSALTDPEQKSGLYLLVRIVMTSPAFGGIAT